VVAACCVLQSVHAQAGEMTLLMNGRYSELDAKMTAVQQAYKRGAITDEELLAAFRPFYDVSSPAIESRLDGWVADKPKSYVARLARGIHFKYVGLAARGDELPSVVPDARFRALDIAFARAAKDLKDSLELDAKPLLSYHHAIDAGGSLFEFTSNRGLLDDAIRLDRGNLVVRRKYLITLSRRWGGSLVKMVDFVEECREAGLPASHIEKLEREVDVERAWQALFTEHDFARAEDLYSRLMATDLDAVKIAEFHLHSLVKQGKWSDVIVAASQLLNRFPRDAFAFANRGLAYVHTEKFSQGVADYQEAAALGNVWALKELARLEWQGQFTAKDRANSLRLLRDAAERGDPEAQREFARITGEKIVTTIPLWQRLLPAGALALLSLVVVTLTARTRNRVPRNLAALRLTHRPGKFAWGATAFSLSAGLALSFVIFPGRLLHTGQILLLAGFALAGLTAIAAYLCVRHDLADEAFTFTRLNGLRDSFAWKEVKRVSFARSTKHFRIETSRGKSAYVACDIRNIQRFACYVLKHVPRDALEESAASLLDELCMFAVNTDWSDADIANQCAAATSRTVMYGGTSTSELALFSTDFLPVSAAAEAPSVEQLEQQGGALGFEIYGAGNYLLHLYFNAPIPPGVLKYTLPKTLRNGVLRMQSGSIAFGGTETMVADFPVDSLTRSDSKVPAGDYAVHLFLMGFPGEMLRQARKSAGGYAPVWVRVATIAIALGVVAAIAALIAGFWWPAGALVAASLGGCRLLLGSEARKVHRARSDAAALNFPNIVAQLRPLSAGNDTVV
jgi:tetratricopeptide (TPR) repeat protein